MSIYIIRHKESDNCYIGSCRDTEERLKKHQQNTNHKDYKIYRFIRENGGWDNFDMVEICKCENDKLREMEQYHIDFIKPSLNTIKIIKRTKEDNSKYYRNYRENHKQKSKDYFKEYSNIIVECECGKTYKRNNKTNHLRTKYHLSHCPPH